MSKIKDIFERIKKIRHIQIILPVLIGLIVCVVYFGFVSKPKSDNEHENSTQQNTSAMEYVDMLENKLCNVLSRISGVGQAEVVITLENGFEYEYATDTETKTTISGGNETSITTETVILVSNEPVVVKEIYPVIKGVVVVADGAENFAVKMNILSAIATVLEIDQANITILA